MPIYPCKCEECGHYEEVVRAVAECRDLPEHCGAQMRRVYTPLPVMEDMKPYRSPLDGSIVSSRAEHRNHMRKHDVIEVGNEKLTRPMQKPYDSGNLKQDIARAIEETSQ